VLVKGFTASKQVYWTVAVMGVRRKFSRVGGTSTFCLSFSGGWQCWQMDVHKTFYFSTPQKKSQWKHAIHSHHFLNRIQVEEVHMSLPNGWNVFSVTRYTFCWI